MGPWSRRRREIVSAVGEKLPTLEPAPVLEPQQACFRLFDSITTFSVNELILGPVMTETAY